MAITPYEQGYRFECRVKKHLESRGWYVIASRGSHQIADLVAARASEIWVIQCKTNGVLTKGEKEHLKAVATEFGDVPILAHRDGRKLIISVITRWSADNPYTPKNGSDPHPMWWREAIEWERDH